MGQKPGEIKVKGKAYHGVPCSECWATEKPNIHSCTQLHTHQCPRKVNKQFTLFQTCFLYIDSRRQVWIKRKKKLSLHVRRISLPFNHIIKKPWSWYYLNGCNWWFKWHHFCFIIDWSEYGYIPGHRTGLAAGVSRDWTCPGWRGTRSRPAAASRSPGPPVFSSLPSSSTWTFTTSVKHSFHADNLATWFWSVSLRSIFVRLTYKYPQ